MRRSSCVQLLSLVLLVCFWCLIAWCGASTNVEDQLKEHTGHDTGVIEIPVPPHIRNAFNKDHFDVAKCVRLSRSAAFGCYATSTLAFTFATKKPKPAMYIEATESYDVGFLYGYLVDKDDAQEIATRFLDRIVVELIDATFAKDHWNSTLYQEVFAFVTSLLTTKALESFEEQVEQGSVFPSSIVEEMNGFLDGICALTSSSSSFTSESLRCSGFSRETVVSLNYAFDVFSARVFSGDIVGLLTRLDEFPLLRSFLKTHPRNEWPFLPPSACDALGLKGKWTKSGSDVFFGRALQFKTANIMQDTFVVLIIVRPQTSFLAVSSVTVPGIVGTMTGINEKGLSMGFDTIRAANANNDRVGINSMLLTRVTLETRSSALDAVEGAAEAKRGCPYLYPLCDAAGDCAVLESGAYVANGKSEDPLQYVEPLLRLEGLVPDHRYLKEYPTNTFKNGMYVRWMNYTDPPLSTYFDTFNGGLFKHAGVQYQSDTMHLGTFLFPTWQDEMKMERILEDDYFFPQKENDAELIAVSNLALIPESRLTMMAFIDDLVASTGEAMVWRYESLLNMSYAFKGQIDFDRFKWIMQFLSPDRTPGYWHNYYDPRNHMTAIVEGVVAIYDLKKRHQFVRTGYWIDELIGIQLMNYIEQP